MATPDSPVLVSPRSSASNKTTADWIPYTNGRMITALTNSDNILAKYTLYIAIIPAIELLAFEILLNVAIFFTNRCIAAAHHIYVRVLPNNKLVEPTWEIVPFESDPLEPDPLDHVSLNPIWEIMRSSDHSAWQFVEPEPNPASDAINDWRSRPYDPVAYAQGLAEEAAHHFRVTLPPVTQIPVLQDAPIGPDGVARPECEGRPNDEVVSLNSSSSPEGQLEQTPQVRDGYVSNALPPTTELPVLKNAHKEQDGTARPQCEGRPSDEVVSLSNSNSSPSFEIVDVTHEEEPS